MFEKCSARSTTTNLRADDHVLNHGPRHGPVSQALNDNKLGGADNFVPVLCNAQMAPPVAEYPGQCYPRNVNVSGHAGEVTFGELSVETEEVLQVALLGVAHSV